MRAFSLSLSIGFVIVGVAILAIGHRRRLTLIPLVAAGLLFCSLVAGYKISAKPDDVQVPLLLLEAGYAHWLWLVVALAALIHIAIGWRHWRTLAFMGIAGWAVFIGHRANPLFIVHSNYLESTQARTICLLGAITIAAWMVVPLPQLWRRLRKRGPAPFARAVSDRVAVDTANDNLPTPRLAATSAALAANAVRHTGAAAAIIVAILILGSSFRQHIDQSDEAVFARWSDAKWVAVDAFYDHLSAATPGQSGQSGPLRQFLKPAVAAAYDASLRYFRLDDFHVIVHPVLLREEVEDIEIRIVGIHPLSPPGTGVYRFCVSTRFHVVPHGQPVPDRIVDH